MWVYKHNTKNTSTVQHYLLTERALLTSTTGFGIHKNHHFPSAFIRTEQKLTVNVLFQRVSCKPPVIKPKVIKFTIETRSFVEGANHKVFFLANHLCLLKPDVIKFTIDIHTFFNKPFISQQSRIIKRTEYFNKCSRLYKLENIIQVFS